MWVVLGLAKRRASLFTEFCAVKGTPIEHPGSIRYEQMNLRCRRKDNMALMSSAESKK